MNRSWCRVALARLVTFAAVLLMAGPTAPGHAQSKASGTARHLIYLHGYIVQAQQLRRPRHPEFGYYELDGILDTFRKEGFVVHGEVRPRGDTVSSAANRTVREIRELLAQGVAPDHVTVLGASMGAAIGYLTAARLGKPRVRYALLGVCLSRGGAATLAHAGETNPAVGRILSIREASDETSTPCPPYPSSPTASGKSVVRELVVHTGLRHGFLYKPLRVWVKPVSEWARTGELSAADRPTR